MATGNVASILNIVSGLLLAPITLHFIGQEAYGINAIINSLVVWTQIATLGFPAWLSLTLAQNSKTQTSSEINQSITTVFWMQFASCFIVLGTAVYVMLRLDGFFEINRLLLDQSQLALILVTVHVIISLIGQTFQMILVAYHHTYYVNLIDALTLPLRFLLILVLLYGGWGMLATIGGVLIIDVITFASITQRAYKLLPQLDLRLKNFLPALIPRVFGLSAWWTIAYVCSILIENTDQIVTGKVISIAAVTVLVLTGRMYALSYGFLQQITRTIRPVFGNLIGKGDWEGLQRVYHQIFVISTGLGVVIAAAIWVGNEAFIQSWVGAAQFGGSLLSLAFAYNLVINIWMQPHLSVLNSAMIARPQTISRIIEATLNLGLSIVLGIRFGIFGIIFATGIAGTLTSFLYLPYRTSKLFKQNYISLLLEELLPMAKTLLIVIPFAFLLNKVSNSIGGYLGAILGSGLMTCIGLVSLWFLAFDAPIKVRLLNMIPVPAIQKFLLAIQPDQRL